MPDREPRSAVAGSRLAEGLLDLCDRDLPALVDAAQLLFYWDGKRYYQYTLEVSLDGEKWSQVVDASKNTTPGTADGVMHYFKPVRARHVRLNILKNSANRAAAFAQGAHQRTLAMMSYIKQGAVVVCAEYDDATAPCGIEGKNCRFQHTLLARRVVFPEGRN